jgi:Asp-tRNA(Asn)/Glu-tRNA(Gln) amidotransferase C subunit
MSYVRSQSSEQIDPELLQKFCQLLGLDMSQEDLASLQVSLAEQLASVSMLDRLDLTDVNSILVMDPRWHE